MLMTAANIYCVLTLPGTVPSALCVVTHAVHVNGFAQCQAQSTRVHVGVCVVIIGYLSSLVSYSSPTPPSGSLTQSSWGTMLCDTCWIHFTHRVVPAFSDSFTVEDGRTPAG